MHRFYLCKPTREVIYEFHFINDIQLKEQLRGVNELTFNVPYNITLEDGETIRNPVVDHIRGDYLVRYDFNGETKDYYIIGDPEDDLSSDAEKEKRLFCYQLQYEWSRKIVRAFKGTLPLYTPVGDQGVLNQTLLRKTDWSVSYIDPSLTKKHRTFDVSEENLLEFVFDAIDNYGNYVPIIDTVNKTISIYLIENYGREAGLKIEYGNYLRSLNAKEDFDNVVTVLYPYGANDMSIRQLNPTGTDFLVNLNFYMHPYEEDSSGNVVKHSNYMSDDLCKAIIKYNKLLEQKSNEFKNLLSKKETLQNQLTQKENEMSTLETEMNVLLDEKDVLISANGNLSNVNQRINAKQAQINSKQSEINGVKSNIDNVDKSIAQLRQQIAIENNFTKEQIIERDYYLRERTWSNASYTNIEDLLEQADLQLRELSQPQVVYSCDIVDLLNALNTEHDRNKLKLGSIITIYYPEFDICIDAKLIEIDHNISSNSLKVTIANTTDLGSSFFRYKDLLKRASNSATTVDMSKHKWDLSEENNTEIENILQNKWDANKRAIEGGDDLQYRLDTRGLTIKNPKDPMKFLRAVNSVLAITNDGGNSYRNAITAQGKTNCEVYGKILRRQIQL